MKRRPAVTKYLEVVAVMVGVLAEVMKLHAGVEERKAVRDALTNEGRFVEEKDT